MFFFLWIFLCNDHFCLQEKGLIVVCSRLSRQRSWHLSQAESSEFFEKQGSIWPLLAQKASPGAVAWGWRTGRWSLAAHRCSSLPLSLGCASALPAPCAASQSAIGRVCSQTVLWTAVSIWGAQGEEHRERKTAPVPWASSAAFLSQERRKKSVSVIHTVQNPVFDSSVWLSCRGSCGFSFYGKDRIVSCDFLYAFLERFHRHTVNN